MGLPRMVVSGGVATAAPVALRPKLTRSLPKRMGGRLFIRRNTGSFSPLSDERVIALADSPATPAGYAQNNCPAEQAQWRLFLLLFS
jgi:hypothetical protein